MRRDCVPEIIIEVVSPSSDERDYTENRDEYWALGAKEYWIVDAKRRQIVKHVRGRARSSSCPAAVMGDAEQPLHLATLVAGSKRSKNLEAFGHVQCPKRRLRLSVDDFTTG